MRRSSTRVTGALAAAAGGSRPAAAAARSAAAASGGAPARRGARAAAAPEPLPPVSPPPPRPKPPPRKPALTSLPRGAGDAAPAGAADLADAGAPAKRRRASTAAAPSSAPAPADDAGGAVAKSRSYEARWWAKGAARVAGVDEAGRGPLAGPVVAAACIIPPGVWIEGVADSKQLSEEQRESLYATLTQHPQVEWSACVVEHTVIDEINILQATMRAMEGAVAGLKRGAPDRVLVDGNRVPAGLTATGEAIIGGDDKSFVIGAASIIAKVTRDRLMLALDAKFPKYGFAQHKGYGTRAHMDAIAKHGPCDAHRRTFAPIKHMI